LALIFNIERIEGIVLAALGSPIAVRQFRQRSKIVHRSVIVAFVPLAVLLAASSIACIAGYFIVLYFLKSHSEIPLQELNGLSGFILVWEAFGNLLNPIIYSAFFALLMVGIFLCLLRTQLNASLGICIGCHTAWVCSGQVFSGTKIGCYTAISRSKALGGR
jgi:hypothetical protein